MLRNIFQRKSKFESKGFSVSRDVSIISFRLLHRNHHYQQPLFSTPAVSTPPPLVPPSSSTDVRRVCTNHQSSSYSFFSSSLMIIHNILIHVIQLTMIIIIRNPIYLSIRKLPLWFVIKILHVHQVKLLHHLFNISMPYPRSILSIQCKLNSCIKPPQAIRRIHKIN